MTKLNIDLNLYANLVREVGDRIIHIKNIFPKGNEHLLKHLAAASIHLAYFSRDIFEIIQGEKIDLDKNMEETFINECGCKMKEK